MPTNKDFKRLVRARMQKTGEAYTTARRQLLQRNPLAKPSTPAPVDYARLAGMSDATIKAKTGCTWERWVMALDYHEAHTWSHRAIAEYVGEKYKVPDWWCQAVTVGYERIKGLRAIGQRRDGGFEASKSKVLAAPVARLYRAFSDRRARARWLPGVALTVRTATRDKSMRITWPDGTSVEVYFTRKGPAKSQVSVQHRKLADRGAATRMKAYWAERLAALADRLADARWQGQGRRGRPALPEVRAATRRAAAPRPPPRPRRTTTAPARDGSTPGSPRRSPAPAHRPDRARSSSFPRSGGT